MKVAMESKQNTASLIRKAREGDREAFNRLVEQYESPLQTAVQKRIGGYLRRRIEVEDVLQETFLKAWQSLASFEDRGEDSFYFWLKGIAENLLLYWARQHQRRDQLQLDGDVKGTDTSPSDRLRREERFERLQESLAGLSPEHREVILLARVQSLSMKEIAERLGKTPEAVKPLLWRALQKLRLSFGETESFHLPKRNLGRTGLFSREESDER